jgi:hypothetical protein
MPLEMLTLHPMLYLTNSMIISNTDTIIQRFRIWFLSNVKPVTPFGRLIRRPSRSGCLATRTASSILFEKVYILRYNTMQSGKSQPAFRRYSSHLSSAMNMLLEICSFGMLVDFTGPQGLTSQKIDLFVKTAVRT